MVQAGVPVQEDAPQPGEGGRQIAERRRQRVAAGPQQGEISSSSSSGQGKPPQVETGDEGARLWAGDDPDGLLQEAMQPVGICTRRSDRRRHVHAKERCNALEIGNDKREEKGH
jgi:hypothetical protein